MVSLLFSNILSIFCHRFRPVAIVLLWSLVPHHDRLLSICCSNPIMVTYATSRSWWSPFLSWDLDTFVLLWGLIVFTISLSSFFLSNIFNINKVNLIIVYDYQQEGSERRTRPCKGGGYYDKTMRRKLHSQPNAITLLGNLQRFEI